MVITVVSIQLVEKTVHYLQRHSSVVNSALECVIGGGFVFESGCRDKAMLFFIMLKNC